MKQVLIVEDDTTLREGICLAMQSAEINTLQGLLYTLGAAVVSLALCLATGPLLSSALGNMFWFFTYRFTILPVVVVIPVYAVLGVLLPLISYHVTARRSIVERLRDADA